MTKEPDIDGLPLPDQVFLLREALKCFALEPSLNLENGLTVAEVQVRIADFLAWVMKQDDLTAISSKALSKHMAESHKLFNSLPDLFHQLSAFKAFFTYTAEHGFFPDVCADFYPEFVGYYSPGNGANRG